MSKTLALLLGLVLVGCGGDPTPAERLQGVWFDANALQCFPSVAFSGSSFSIATICASSNGNAQADIEAGTFVATDTKITVTIDRASCPATASKSFAVGYALTGGSLVLSDASATLSLVRTTPGVGSGTVMYGCIADDGTFTPMPISSL